MRYEKHSELCYLTRVRSLVDVHLPSSKTYTIPNLHIIQSKHPFLIPPQPAQQANSPQTPTMFSKFPPAQSSPLSTSSSPPQPLPSNPINPPTYIPRPCSPHHPKNSPKHIKNDSPMLRIPGRPSLRSPIFRSDKPAPSMQRSRRLELRSHYRPANAYLWCSELRLVQCMYLPGT